MTAAQRCLLSLVVQPVRQLWERMRKEMFGHVGLAALFPFVCSKKKKPWRDAGAESGDETRSRAGGGFQAAASAAACALAFPAEIRLE